MIRGVFTSIDASFTFPALSTARTITRSDFDSVSGTWKDFRRE